MGVLTSTGTLDCTNTLNGSGQVTDYTCTDVIYYDVESGFYDMWFNIFMIIFTVFFLGWKVLILVFKKW